MINAKEILERYTQFAKELMFYVYPVQAKCIHYCKNGLEMRWNKCHQWKLFVKSYFVLDVIKSYIHATLAKTIFSNLIMLIAMLLIIVNTETPTCTFALIVKKRIAKR